MLLDFLQKDKLPKRVERLFSPRIGFAEKTAALFLSRFGGQRGFSGAKRAPFLLKFAVAAFAAADVLLGTAAYADNLNVGPAHPLYAAKKYAESASLLLAERSEKPQLYAKFAERRLEEISDLEKSGNAGASGEAISHATGEPSENEAASGTTAAPFAAAPPANGLRARLTEELNYDLENAAKGIKNATAEESRSVCGRVGQAMQSLSSTARGVFRGQANGLRRLEKECPIDIRFESTKVED